MPHGKKDSKMKRKISVFFAFLSFAAFLWAQNPTKGFPYYYYDTSERNFSDYSPYLSGKSTLIEENDEHTIRMYKNGSSYYIWCQYKRGKAASKSDIKHTLKVNSDVAANLDSRLDRKQGCDMSVCMIFTDSESELICSAKYSGM